MKRLLQASFLILVGLLIWYLFLKPFELTSTLSYNTNEGTIFQTIKTWANSIPEIDMVEVSANDRMVQKVVSGDKIYSYLWEIEEQNDSLSKITISLTEPENRFFNKLSVPFTETAIETEGRKHLSGFNQVMKEHLENIKVTVVGIDTIDRFKCVYIALKTTQKGKAYGMMQSFSMLSSFVADNELDVGGVPFIEVTKWNEQEDTVHFNFGYPINEGQEPPKPDFFEYKWIEKVVGIKAVYNGNYITSDRAWYALQNYAEKNGLQTANKPIEFFYDNPNFGYREREWKAEVFLPLNIESL